MRGPLRITEIWQKSLYILGVEAVGGVGFLVLRTWVVGENTWQYAVVGLVYNVAVVTVGVRIFRGFREPLDPRAWWRWTGRPKAGYWLAAFELLPLAAIIQGAFSDGPIRVKLSVTVVNLLQSGLVAFGYFNSSIRLSRHPELWSQSRRNPLPSETAAETPTGAPLSGNPTA